MFVLTAAVCSLAVLAAGVLTLTVGAGTTMGVPQLFDRFSPAANKAPQVKVGSGRLPVRREQGRHHPREDG
ncbi:hypothetical protein ACIRFH_33835 [Streptomyces sp. NPDC093586]|uniref:hypothetical protein n=1 Tax=Streptomyces sp. NPDC093586 TaxID=3366042 RepID=UPI003804753D